VVNAILQKPIAGAQIKGEFGVYAGSFDTAKCTGILAMPLFGFRLIHANYVFLRALTRHNQTCY